MISVDLLTPLELQRILADRLRALRLELNLSQRTLSLKSGVSYGSLKKIEQSGQISLHSLLKLALVIGRMEDFKLLFAPKPAEQALSLHELMKDIPEKEADNKRGNNAYKPTKFNLRILSWLR